MTDTTQLKIDLEKAEFMRQVMLDSLDYFHTELTEEAHLDFLHALYGLVEAEQGIVTRITLMNDPAFDSILKALAGPQLFERLEFVSPLEYYIKLKAEVRALIEEASGEDLDEPVDLM